MAKNAKPTDKITMTLTRQEWNALWAALSGNSALGAKILKVVS